MTPQRPTLGFIGTGVIGGACVKRLLDARFDVYIYTRSKEKALALLDDGAKWAESPAKLAANVDVAISCVGFPNDVKDVFFGNDGLLAGWTQNKNVDPRQKIYIDMSTSSPELAVQIDDAARPFGIKTLDAPVSGGDVGARNGTLSIMVGGEEETLARVTPILLNLGSNIRHAGTHGAGQRTKLANQILIAGTMIGVCEALLYAYKAGLDLENMLASVATGAAGSWSLSNYAPRILRADYAPGFYVEHFIKDMKLALDDAKKLNIDLPGLALVHQLYQKLAEMGGAKKGTHALIQALAALSNVDAFRGEERG